MFSTDELCSLRWDPTRQTVEVIDQTLLPHTLRWCHLDSLDAFCHAITSMQVRGAPLIGITAAYGLAHALQPILHPRTWSERVRLCWRRVPRRSICTGPCNR